MSLFATADCARFRIKYVRVAISIFVKVLMSYQTALHTHPFLFISASFNRFLPQVATGGIDSVVRLWTPHTTTRPSASLAGHDEPVVHVAINADENQILRLPLNLLTVSFASTLAPSYFCFSTWPHGYCFVKQGVRRHHQHGHSARHGARACAPLA